MLVKPSKKKSGGSVSAPTQSITGASIGSSLRSASMGVIFKEEATTQPEVESHVDAYGIRRCSKTLMPIESDGVGVEFPNIRDTI